MEDEDGYMSIESRRRDLYSDAIPSKEEGSSSKRPYWKVILWVLLGGSIALNVVLAALFLAFQMGAQDGSCPQSEACSCAWIPGSITAYVILDPATAHPRIDVSMDGKTAAWGNTAKSLPNNTERFNHRVWVLGREGFLSDKHCWEVQVNGNGEWAVGVAKQSVRRKGLPDFSTKEGIWGIGEYWGIGNYVAFTSPQRTQLSFHKKPRRIRVFLDYTNRQVEFFNAETKVSIFLFNSTSFNGEKVFPWFRLWYGTTLVLHP